MCIGRFSSAAVAMTAWNFTCTALAVLLCCLTPYFTLLSHARTTLLISRRGTSTRTCINLFHATVPRPRPTAHHFHIFQFLKKIERHHRNYGAISRFTSCLQSAHTTHIPELSYRTYFLVCPESVHAVGIVSSPSLLQSYTETGQEGTQRGRADQTRKEAGVLLISDNGTIADEFRPSLGRKLLFFCGLDRFTG